MSTTLRLVFPQWQGGEAHNIAHYVSELVPQEAMQGYAIGAQLLAWLAPPSAETVSVPVSMETDAAAVATEHGILPMLPIWRSSKRTGDFAAEAASRRKC